MSNCLSKRIHLVSEMFTVLLRKELFSTKETTVRQKRDPGLPARECGADSTKQKLHMKLFYNVICDFTTGVRDGICE